MMRYFLLVLIAVFFWGCLINPPKIEKKEIFIPKEKKEEYSNLTKGLNTAELAEFLADKRFKENRKRQIDLNLFLNRVYSKDEMLVYEYGFLSNLSSFEIKRVANFRFAKSMNDECNNPIIRHSLKKGVILSHRYFYSDKLLFSFKIDDEKCKKFKL